MAEQQKIQKRTWKSPQEIELEKRRKELFLKKQWDKFVESFIEFADQTGPKTQPVLQKQDGTLELGVPGATGPVQKFFTLMHYDMDGLQAFLRTDAPGGGVDHYDWMNIMKTARFLEIPDEYNGKPVQEIRGHAFSGERFSGNAFLAGVKIPESVKILSPNAFYRSANLRFVDCASEIISEDAFRECPSLERVRLTKAKKIESDAFRYAGEHTKKGQPSFRIPKGCKMCFNYGTREFTDIQYTETNDKEIF